MIIFLRHQNPFFLFSSKVRKRISRRRWRVGDLSAEDRLISGDVWKIITRVYNFLPAARTSSNYGRHNNLTPLFQGGGRGGKRCFGFNNINKHRQIDCHRPTTLVSKWLSGADKKFHFIMRNCPAENWRNFFVVKAAPFQCRLGGCKRNSNYDPNYDINDR